MAMNSGHSEELRKRKNITVSVSVSKKVPRLQVLAFGALSSCAVPLGIISRANRPDLVAPEHYPTTAIESTSFQLSRSAWSFLRIPSPKRELSASSIMLIP